MANIQTSIGFAFTIQQKFNLEKAINYLHYVYSSIKTKVRD